MCAWCRRRDHFSVVAPSWYSHDCNLIIYLPAVIPSSSSWVTLRIWRKDHPLGAHWHFSTFRMPWIGVQYESVSRRTGTCNLHRWWIPGAWYGAFESSVWSIVGIILRQIKTRSIDVKSCTYVAITYIGLLVRIRWKKEKGPLPAPVCQQLLIFVAENRWKRVFL